MPGLHPKTGLALVACAIGLAACGGEDGGTIPQGDGEALLAQLGQVEDAVQAGDCAAARQAAVGFADRVDQLPDEVDSEVHDGLVNAAGNLTELADDPTQCEPDTGATGEIGTTPPPETAPPVEPQPEPPAEEPAEEEPDDGGQGQGGQQGGENSGDGGGGGGGGSSGGVGSDDG